MVVVVVIVAVVEVGFFLFFTFLNKKIYVAISFTIQSFIKSSVAFAL